MTERREMEAVAEAILFVANEPVARDKLLEVFAEKEREQAAEALEAVLQRYRQDPFRGIVVDEVAGGLRLVSRPDLHGYLRRFFEVSGRNKLTMAALEALAIIAYRQPITNPEIQELRNVNSAGVLKKLLERRLIRIAGRKEVVGKPFLYATTREFLMHFGLRSLKELPPLEQFEELFGGDVELPAGSEPDMEEQIGREATDLEEAESDVVQKIEADAAESEREAAEAAQEAAEEEKGEEERAAGGEEEEAAAAEAEEEAVPDETAAETEEAAPEADLATAESEEAAPEADLTAAETEEAGPEADLTAAETEEAAPEAEETAAETEEAAPEADETAAESEKAAPEADETAAEVEAEQAVAEDETAAKTEAEETAVAEDEPAASAEAEEAVPAADETAAAAEVEYAVAAEAETATETDAEQAAETVDSEEAETAGILDAAPAEATEEAAEDAAAAGDGRQLREMVVAESEP